VETLHQGDRGGVNCRLGDAAAHTHTHTHTQEEGERARELEEAGQAVFSSSR